MIEKANSSSLLKYLRTRISANPSYYYIIMEKHAAILLLARIKLDKDLCQC